MKLERNSYSNSGKKRFRLLWTLLTANLDFYTCLKQDRSQKFGWESPQDSEARKTEGHFQSADISVCELEVGYLGNAFLAGLPL